MIELYKFNPAFGLPDPSPFCMKVETFLRMTDMEYRTVQLTDPHRGPKGKLPFIRDGMEVVPDSGFIVSYLIKRYKCPIDDHLNPTQRATGVAINRMLDEHLYWAIVYSRWMDETTWPLVRKQFFGGLPIVVRQLIPVFARHQVKQQLRGHGMGRHDPGEIYELATDDLRAVSNLLGEQDYIFGSRPVSYDATIYAFLAGIIETTLETPLKQEATKHSNLVAYCRRMKNRYF